jgi:hypothetical protein
LQPNIHFPDVQSLAHGDTARPVHYIGKSSDSRPRSPISVYASYYSCIAGVSILRWRVEQPTGCTKAYDGQRQCRFDIQLEGSYFLEFYDLLSITDDDCESGSDGQTSEESDQEVSTMEPLLLSWKHSPSRTTTLIHKDNTTLCLPSGRIISRRSAASSFPGRPVKHHRTRSPTSLITIIHDGEDLGPSTATSPRVFSPQETIDVVLGTTSSSSLTKQAERDKAFIVQLSNVPHTDRPALAHLPAAEKQALLATVQETIDESDRAEKRLTGKMDGLGNQKVVERFVNNIPGARSHKNRFLAV